MVAFVLYDGIWMWGIQ